MKALYGYFTLGRHSVHYTPDLLHKVKLHASCMQQKILSQKFCRQGKLLSYHSYREEDTQVLLLPGY